LLRHSALKLLCYKPGQPILDKNPWKRSAFAVCLAGQHLLKY